MAQTRADQLAARPSLASLLVRSTRGFEGKYIGFLAISDALAAVTIFGVMLLVVVDLSGRYLFSKPLPGTTELVEAMLVFVVFLAIGYVEAKDTNIRVDILATRLRRRGRSLVNLLACLVSLFFFGLVLRDTLGRAVDSWEVNEFMSGMLPWPVWPSRFMVPIGCAMVMLQFVIKIIVNVSDLFRTEPAT